ncbi:peptidoglycan DD-metalloendopeptidase family protein [Varibaculum massiliense]|uniref:peptidoglycan DD-metalloendopeptidase family protein n=1 Tax=Varibaculum massiliense TaxID=1852372 RepID=UPI0008DA018D|nr:peptidoglycan DD-metalloendopeptidase family protein [Varibaculum massiliense]
MSLHKNPTILAILFTTFLTVGCALPASAAQYCTTQTQDGTATGTASGAISGQTPTKAIPWVKAAYDGAGHRLPANFFAGMMYYESNFTPQIRNSLGYMGLCQIGTEEWKHLTGGTPSSPNIYDPLIHAKYCGKLSAENLDKVHKARSTNLPANLKSLPDWQLVILAHNAGPAYLTPQKKGKMPAETRRSIERMMPYMKDANATSSSVSVAGGGVKAGAATNPRALKAAIQKAINPAAWDGKFDAPAPGGLHVTSPYGPRRHPVTGQMQSLHAGTDYAQAEGNPQYATAPGTVLYTKYEGTGGNTVCIDHGEFAGATWKTCHRHLSKFLVKPGQQVQKGTPIGLTGSTGRVTGAHIHYEIHQNGKPINPEPFMKGATANPTSEPGTSGATDGFCSIFSNGIPGLGGAGGVHDGGQDSSKPGSEPATIPDPTGTGGKITPRMKRFYDEAAKAGYGKPGKGIGCWRPDSMKWHPSGTACDYMFDAGKPATGEQLRRGNEFANWAIDNSKRLEVHYLIWQGKIWTRSSGKWKQYGGYGGPTKQNATTGHYDHVHVNVY